ncbi:nickel-dependent hydrogenase large subunit [Thermodesulfobacterium hydrogeniphilum]|uniref:nickel-dependent hydrogenase large subunit n=1 Tax=Thermodesulfobacterium hydrogeniphilum TaxID=161156 RepID=UPI00056ED146|nr:nickel-dependent hydrogenase large subunit [Thermodesulfobacterium hydrogeniphilum]
MAQRITIDPLTRIEGHLRIDVEVAGGKVVNAWSSTQMWRGIEVILKGRDPRDAWAFTQRICGVCTTVHAIASVRAVENALGMEIPLNAQYVRNIILCAHGIHDHMVHFYHLSALDWVDIISALKADPKKTAELAQTISDWEGNSVTYFKSIKEKLQKFVERGQIGPFTNGYWGHPQMKLPPEVNLLAVAHYLTALDYQFNADKVVAILGGKNPHIQTVIVGGVGLAINPDNEATLNMERLDYIRELLLRVKEYTQKVYLNDVIAIGCLYKDWFKIGRGVTNYLAVPDLPLDTKGTKFDLPGGTIFNGDLSTYHPIKSFNDPYFRDNITETVAHSWYKDTGPRHPWQGETIPNYTDFDPNGKYSWAKAPRFKGEPMQVGPLAQVLMGIASKHEPTMKWVNYAIEKAKTLGVNLTVNDLHSTMGRHLARAIRAAVLADLALKHLDLLEKNIAKGDLEIWNEVKFPRREIKGFGFHEAPRGTLSHWVVIERGKIKNYQCVVPSTWNVSPRDEKGKKGPYEASLIDNPIVDPEKPLEVLRTIHSFDPCIACAVHVLDSKGKEIKRVKVL